MVNGRPSVKTDNVGNPLGHGTTDTVERREDGGNLRINQSLETVPRLCVKSMSV